MDAALKPVILTYHSISDGRSPLEISPALFAEQMEWLKANTRVAPLKEVVEALEARQKFSERSVVLTFDDGFVDFYTAAAPVLERLELSATVFLPTAHLGGKNNWPGQLAWVKPQQLMDWTHVSELAKRGIEFGSHSVSHPDLTKLSAAKLESELEKSKSEIESRTGKPAAYFCYPYGLWNPLVRDATEVTYRGACATGAGVVEANADHFALPRVDAHYVRDMKRFRTLFTGGFVRYVTVRRWIRRLRGQPEGTYARA
jgi:peptidoglycan/xylan/chitin deacetylase (PgdA/CDA1 family)